MLILITAVFAVILAFILGFALGFFREFFKVETDPLVGQVRECLPGANCGGCGFPGCDGYASAVASKTAEINRCTVGGKAVAEKIAKIIGGDATVIPVVSVLACQGSRDHAHPKGDYRGLQTCRGAKLSAGGTKLCAFGCLGFGDCSKVCQFGAISVGTDGIPHIDESLCTGCKACAAECPQQLLKVIPRDRKGAMPLCSNRSALKAKAIKDACEVGCIKCEACVKNCPEKCVTMDKGIPSVDYGKCTGCGTCVEKCRQKVMKLVARDVLGEGAEPAKAVS